MATFDSASLLSMYAPAEGTPAGFTMAGNQLSRVQIAADAGEAKRRLQSDFNSYTLPGIYNSQAARGALDSGATRRKRDQAEQQYLRQYGDIGNTEAFSLARLGMSDIGASIPGVSF